MPNYKVVVSKDNKRFNIALKADNELAAREKVHSEWYSILTLQEISENEQIGATFVFEWYKMGQFKHWKIAWNDIFKAYVKLTRDLGYKVDYIYSEKDEDLPLERKEKIVKELEEEYKLFYGSEKNQKKVEEVKTNPKENIDVSTFYINKELEEVNALIFNVMEKLKQIVSWEYLPNIDLDTKEKLKQVYNEIVKIQKTTNISKLREVWELALTKIWELELAQVEATKTEQNRELLKKTNKLLKELWSKKQFIEKEKDLWYQTKKLFWAVKEVFWGDSSSWKKSKKADYLDKESYSFVKNRLYLNKYKARYKENTKFIIKNLFKILINKEMREEILLERNVLKQNIDLFRAREKWVNASYTYIKKWLGKLFNAFLDFFKSLNYYIFFVLIIYSVVFMLYFATSRFIEFPWYNFDWIFLFITLILAYISIYTAKNILILFINFVILAFIIIFWVINF